MSASPARPPTPGPTDHRYAVTHGTVYLTGIQALARTLVERARLDRGAGREPALFVSGYEGSPLAGFDLELARHPGLLAEHGVVHRPGLNEELAATAVAGSQLAGRIGTLRRAEGVTGFWYGKAPGLDRACDALRHANIVGADPHGGAVAFVGDDPGAKSSTIPSASEMALADLYIPVFCPSDTQDILDHTRHAVQLSRASGLWTGVKLTTTVADGSGTTVLDPDWIAPDLSGFDRRPYSHTPEGRVLGARLMALERDLYETRIPLALEYIRRSDLNMACGDSHARIGIVAAGKPYRDVCQALATLGLDPRNLQHSGVRMLKLDVISPVEPSALLEFACGLEEIIVVEEKRSFLETSVRERLYGRTGAPAVYGKTAPDGGILFSPAGELDPDSVARALAGRLTAHGIAVLGPSRARRERINLPLAARTPFFCSGCPHNSSTKVDPGTLVGAGIGCHTMVLLMPGEDVGHIGSVAQMGGEGMHWVGAEPFVEEAHLVQNMGDGTFAHSGSLAIRAAVAAGSNITYKILYNSTVAMTGGQDAVGALTVDRLAELMRIEGVAKVVITSDDPKRVRRRVPRTVEVHHRDDLAAVQRRLAAIPGVTVLIHDQACAAETRRKRKRGNLPTPTTKVAINERVCEGCGDCGAKSNCLSVQPVETEFGRKTRIDQSSCNLDYSCLAGDCPAFLTVRPGKAPAKTRREAEVLGFGDSPEPDPVCTAERFAMRISGTGGTGVVTVAQVLGTAADLDGHSVTGLDQTGLAQKGGAVISDLKITCGPHTGAAKLAAAECDLHIGADALVAVEPGQLATLAPDRTVAVVSTSRVPTGAMVVDPGVTYPDPTRIRELIDDSCREAHYLDAAGRSEALFGSSQFANMLLVGAAYQTGALPISAKAIEQAIAINGVSVDVNLQAFRHGRRLVATRYDHVADKPEPAGLEALLAVRVPDLVDYQNQRYAQDYVDFVHQVASTESMRCPGSTSITEAVARYLYKLMAYKDEYEVARLSLDPALTTDLERQFGAGVRFSYQLQPPALRALGMQKKISIGAAGRPVFRLLRAMRGLRGSRFDPFGRAHIRRVERTLIAEYRNVMEDALGALTAANHPLVLELAELPDLVRGYEQVKQRSVNEYRRRMGELLAELGS